LGVIVLDICFDLSQLVPDPETPYQTVAVSASSAHVRAGCYPQLRPYEKMVAPLFFTVASAIVATASTGALAPSPDLGCIDNGTSLSRRGNAWLCGPRLPLAFQTQQVHSFLAPTLAEGAKLICLQSIFHHAVFGAGPLKTHIITHTMKVLSCGRIGPWS
jgi:hypothetical protein